MALGARSKDKRVAYLGIKLKRADGKEVDFGTVSNKPIIGKIQKYIVDMKIRKYRRMHDSR